jgi:polyisoprenoid-binding protein YceI
MKMTTMISAMAAMVLVPAMGALAQSSTWAIDPAHSQAGRGGLG